MNQYQVYNSCTDKIYVSQSIKVNKLSLYKQDIKKSYVNNN